MQQIELNMLTVYRAPRMVDAALVAACATYRQAVRLCWAQRSRPALKRIALAAEAGLHRSHLTDYLSESDTKRELPARKIDAFERACGNRAITQWFVLQALRDEPAQADMREAA